MGKVNCFHLERKVLRQGRTAVLIFALIRKIYQMYCALGVRTSAQSLVFLFCRFNASLPFKVSSAWIYS